eukprot:6403203-Ditylum_brightwellii.AAC.2
MAKILAAMTLEFKALRLEIRENFAKNIHTITEAFLTNAQSNSDVHQTISTLLNDYGNKLLLHICRFGQFCPIYQDIHTLEQFPPINPNTILTALAKQRHLCKAAAAAAAI